MLKLDSNQKSIWRKEFNTFKAIKDLNRLVNQINKKYKELAERAMDKELKY